MPIMIRYSGILSLSIYIIIPRKLGVNPIEHQTILFTYLEVGGSCLSSLQSQCHRGCVEIIKNTEMTIS
jgi:hypothetical protein